VPITVSTEVTTLGVSHLFSGRYNCGIDLYPDDPDWGTHHEAGEVWPALYVGLSWGICVAEQLRHLSPSTLLSKLANLQLSQLRLDLEHVLDCTDLKILDADPDLLFHNTDYSAGRELARSARAIGCEALLLPSASQIPDDDARIMVVFPDLLRSTSVLRVVCTVKPSLANPQP
jgi:hypothetical protein